MGIRRSVRGCEKRFVVDCRGSKPNPPRIVADETVSHFETDKRRRYN